MNAKTYTDLQHTPTGRPKVDRLTPAVIGAMVPGDEFADPEAPGLRVRRGTGEPVFFYRYRDKAGALRQVKLGTFGPMTLAAARKARDKLRVEIDSGGDPQQRKRQEREDAKAKRDAKKAEQARERNTVGYVVESYLTELVDGKRKDKGAAETRRMLERAISKVRDMPADDVTRELAHKIVHSVAKSAPRVAQMTRQALRAAWEHAIAVGRVKTANPFLGKTIGGDLSSNDREVTLDAAEVGTLLRWMREPNTFSRTVRDALELTLRTGLRSGEVCGIHSSELEERDGVLWLDIPGARMKQGKPHSVPLVGRAREIVLERLPEAGGYLFPTRDGKKPIEQKVLGVEVYACSGRSKAAAFAHRKVCPVVYPRRHPGVAWAPHDLRRTARTLLADLGCPFEIGEAILAHKLPGVAGTYNRARYDEQKVEWLTKLGDYLDKLTEARNVVALPAAKRAA